MHCILARIGTTLDRKGKFYLDYSAMSWYLAGRPKPDPIKAGPYTALVRPIREFTARFESELKKRSPGVKCERVTRRKYQEFLASLPYDERALHPAPSDEVQLLLDYNNLQRFADHYVDLAHTCDILEHTGHIYIISCAKYESDNCYKVGRTNDLDKRLSSYNTGRTPADNMYIIYSRPCYDPASVEARLLALLAPWKIQKNKEMVTMPKEHLLLVFNAVLDHANRELELVNMIMGKSKLD